jgi:predicted MFS family arabinose efflux permease
MSGNIRVEHVFIYSAVTAVIFSFATPGRQAFVPSLVPKQDLLSAMALNSVTWQGTAVIGPALAGFILAFWGLPGSFNINVASDVVSLAAILMVRLPPAASITRAASDSGAFKTGLGELKEGLDYAWHNGTVRILLISIAVVTFLARPYAQFMPAFARDVFEVGPDGLGIMMTAPAIGTIAAGIALAMRGRVPLARLFLATTAILAMALLAFCITRSVPVALGILVVVGACASTSITAVQTLLQQVVDERLRGRVMALFMTCSWGAWRLGSLPIGLAADAWGVSVAVGAAAVILLLCVGPLMRSRWLREAETAATTNHI